MCPIRLASGGEIKILDSQHRPQNTQGADTEATCLHAGRAPLPWRKVSACRMAFALLHLLRGLSSSRESLISASVVCGEARQLPREMRDPELLGGLEVWLLRGGL